MVGERLKHCIPPRRFHREKRRVRMPPAKEMMSGRLSSFSSSRIFGCLHASRTIGISGAPTP